MIIETTLDLTICIPACSRPEKLDLLLQSIRGQGNVSRILVGLLSDKSEQDIDLMYQRVLESYQDLPLDIARFNAPCSPARLRKSLGELVTSEYLLYLDDDLILRPGTIKALLSPLLSFPELSITSCRWLDHRGTKQKERSLGFVYFYNYPGKDRVYKRAVSIPLTENDPVILDDLHASLMMRRSTLDHVTFDENYDFFLDLFDFFYSCKQKGLACAAVPSLTIDHFPGGYLSASLHNQARDLKPNAIKYFTAKWACLPVL